MEAGDFAVVRTSRLSGTACLAWLSLHLKVAITQKVYRTGKIHLMYIFVEHWPACPSTLLILLPLEPHYPALRLTWIFSPSVCDMRLRLTGHHPINTPHPFL